MKNFNTNSLLHVLQIDLRLFACHVESSVLERISATPENKYY